MEAACSPFSPPPPTNPQPLAKQWPPSLSPRRGGGLQAPRSRFPATQALLQGPRRPGLPGGTHLSLAAAPPLELPGPARLLPQAAILEKGFANVSAERGSGWRGSAEGGEGGFGSRLPRAAGKRSPAGGRQGIPGNGRLLSHKLQTPAILAAARRGKGRGEGRARAVPLGKWSSAAREGGGRSGRGKLLFPGKGGRGTGHVGGSPRARGAGRKRF